jgi:hypothetical protein
VALVVALADLADGQVGVAEVVASIRPVVGYVPSV